MKDKYKVMQTSLYLRSINLVVENVINATSNGTIIEEEKVGKIVLQWYIVIAFVFGTIIIVGMFYKFCIAPSKNKRKIHDLITEARVETADDK